VFIELTLKAEQEEYVKEVGILVLTFVLWLGLIRFDEFLMDRVSRGHLSR
jgi:hypothetical protein